MEKLKLTGFLGTSASLRTPRTNDSGDGGSIGELDNWKIFNWCLINLWIKFKKTKNSWRIWKKKFFYRAQLLNSCLYRIIIIVTVAQLERHSWNTSFWHFVQKNTVWMAVFLLPKHFVCLQKLSNFEEITFDADENVFNSEWRATDVEMYSDKLPSNHNLTALPAY